MKPATTFPIRDTARDLELAHSIKSGDAAAFRTLYLLYRPALVDITTTLLRSYEDAEELVQDVFARLWANRLEWRIPNNVAAYLYASARNGAIDKARLNHVQTRTEIYSNDIRDAAMSAGIPQPDRVVEQSDLYEALEKAIASLSPARREVVTLRWRHGLSLEEIAAIVGSSVKAVSMQIARTREQLAPLLERFRD